MKICFATTFRKSAKSAPSETIRERMIILALDTALDACSAAVAEVARDADCVDRLARRYAVLGTGHAEAIMPMIADVLAEARLVPGDISRIGVTIGPGSFTGLRTGLSAARGLALALGIPAIGITSCAALAATAPREGALLIAIDARRGELFFAAYDEDRNEVLAPCAMAPDAAAARFADKSRWWIAGSGASLLAEAFEKIGVSAHQYPDLFWPDAAAMMSLIAHSSPADHPAAPLYLRAADAKRPGGG